VTVLVAVGITALVAVAVGVLACVAVGVTAVVAVLVGVDVFSCVAVAVGVAVLVAMAVPVAVSVAVGVTVAVSVGVKVGKTTGVSNWSGVGGKVAVGGPWVLVGTAVKVPGGKASVAGLVAEGVEETTTGSVGGNSLTGASGAITSKTTPAR
jgi:hypothetical protein